MVQISAVAAAGSAHTVLGARRYWMDAALGDRFNPHMAHEFLIDKLSDEFGQYTLILKCDKCGHERITQPTALGRICGWDSRLIDVARRMRCSKCSAKQCSLRAVPPRKPRGYKSLPN